MLPALQQDKALPSVAPPLGASLRMEVESRVLYPEFHDEFGGHYNLALKPKPLSPQKRSQEMASRRYGCTRSKAPPSALA